MKTKNNMEETPLSLSNIRIPKEIRKDFDLEGKMIKKVLILSIVMLLEGLIFVMHFYILNNHILICLTMKIV